jgi:hypothetical protein
VAGTCDICKADIETSHQSFFWVRNNSSWSFPRGIYVLTLQVCGTCPLATAVEADTIHEVTEKLAVRQFSDCNYISITREADGFAPLPCILSTWFDYGPYNHEGRDLCDLCQKNGEVVSVKNIVMELRTHRWVKGDANFNVMRFMLCDGCFNACESADTLCTGKDYYDILDYLHSFIEPRDSQKAPEQ